MGRGGQHNFARNTRKPLISLGIIGLLALVGCWVDDVDYNFKAERPGEACLQGFASVQAPDGGLLCVTDSCPKNARTVLAPDGGIACIPLH